MSQQMWKTQKKKEEERKRKRKKKEKKKKKKKKTTTLGYLMNVFVSNFTLEVVSLALHIARPLC